MSQSHLIIEQAAYELWLDEKMLTRLPGGATALLAGAGSLLREIDLETAIEHSEDWLMPFSTLLEGLQLTVHDKTNRLQRHFGEQDYYSLDQTELAFTKVHDEVVHQRVDDRDSVADIVLLRELAHHGRLSRIAFA